MEKPIFELKIAEDLSFTNLNSGVLLASARQVLEARMQGAAVAVRRMN